MADSKVISVRIPQEILERINAIADREYPSRKGAAPNKSQVILDAIDLYLAKEDDSLDSVNNEAIPENWRDEIRAIVLDVLKEESRSQVVPLGEFQAA